MHTKAVRGLDYFKFTKDNLTSTQFSNIPEIANSYLQMKIWFLAPFCH